MNMMMIMHRSRHNCDTYKDIMNTDRRRKKYSPPRNQNQNLDFPIFDQNPIFSKVVGDRRGIIFHASLHQNTSKNGRKIKEKIMKNKENREPGYARKGEKKMYLYNPSQYDPSEIR